MTGAEHPENPAGSRAGPEQGQAADGEGDVALPQACPALAYLRAALQHGEPWFAALLAAIRLWDRIEEEHDGRRYRYLIGGEAFDWLLLAERLTGEVREYIPDDELEELLFNGRPPQPVDREAFCRSIGPDKYRNYLNYFYGVTIEEALLLATEEELLKAEAGVFCRDSRAAEDAYQHIYGASVRRLRGEFSAERGLDPRQPLAFDEYKEFTYWLFKRRVRTNHPARVASDTKKGLQALLRHRRDLDIPPPSVEEDLAADVDAEGPALENTAG